MNSYVDYLNVTNQALSQQVILASNPLFLARYFLPDPEKRKSVLIYHSPQHTRVFANNTLVGRSHYSTRIKYISIHRLLRLARVHND